MTENTNPLKRYYRQPQISIQLPSKARYYAADVVETTTTGEHPVLPMTAIDELAFRTPDSMMNGQATVDVIKSCIPTILDPWQLVNYDIDTVLIAIRIASYGETIDVTSGVPGTNESATHTVSLPQMLEQLRNIEVTDTCELKDGLKITVSPLTYKQITESQLKTFEQQRIYAQVSQSQMTAEEKTKRFTDSFKVLSELNMSLLISNIDRITLPSGESVTDRAQIKQFVENADAKLIKELENKLIDIRQQGSIKPFKAKATEEQIKAGAPATYEVPITFDNANFFV
jgi:hypothetical protein